MTMKAKFAASAIAIGTALAPMLVPAADQDPARNHPAAFVKDAELTSRIKARLTEEKLSSLANITIDADVKGAVILRGKVQSEQDADRMIFIVHRIAGVTAVKSLFSIAGDK